MGTYIQTVPSGLASAVTVPDYATYLDTYVRASTDGLVKNVETLPIALDYVNNAAVTYQDLYPHVKADPAVLAYAIQKIENYFSALPAATANAAPLFKALKIAGSRATDVCDPIFDPTCGSDSIPGFPSVTISVGSPIAGLIQVINDNLHNIASDVADAIGSQTTVIGGLIGGIVGDITGAISDQTHSLQDFINGALGGIGNTLTNIFGGIGDALKTATSAIVGALGGIVRGIGTILEGIGLTLKTKFTELIDAIKANGVQAIIPVIQLIVVEMQNIRNVIAAIHTDLHSGMAALVLLPSQIASSLGSLDATLNRALQQLGIATMPKVTTDVTLGDAPFSSTFASSLENNFSGGGGYDLSGVFHAALSSLGDSCDWNVQRQWWLNQHPNLSLWQQWVKWLEESALGWAVRLMASFDVIAKTIKLAEEDANRKCPIEKLSPSDAVQAWLKGYIDDGTMKKELLEQGIDSTRSKVLQELASATLDAVSALDAWHRGIISDTDLDHRLSVLGNDASIRNTLKALSYKLPAVDDVLLWLKRGKVNEATARGVLAQLAINQAQIDLIMQTYQQGAPTSQHIALSGRLDALGNNYPSRLLTADMPQTIKDAAFAEGITLDNAQLQWVQHFAYPSYLTVIQAMFRLLRTETDAKNAMTAENIPSEFHDELIKLQRPLIPFRSIPAFLKAGIMTVGDAALELSSHGFDPQHIGWLLAYATKASKTAPASTVTGLQSLAVNTARTLFDDGAISEDQYIQVLEAHKYTPELARLQADVELMNAHGKQRRAQIADMVNEVLAGSLTVDDALAQLHSQNFTLAEISRFQKEVRSATRAIAKHPTLADLKVFLKAQIISLDQFRAELQLQGWADPWLAAFVQLETPIAP